MDDWRLDPFSKGFVLGLLVGEGHFGGDGRQPQVVLRMHVRHEKLFNWLMSIFPAARLYGPYHHDGRHYYQWMARGWVLRWQIWPLLVESLPFFDDHIRNRIVAMAKRYGLPLEDADAPGDEELPSADPS